MLNIIGLARALPKAELHLHIEGTLEPGLTFALARKHGVTLPYPDEAALAAAYRFDNLQSFLDLYYAGASVLRDEEDFYLLARAYLQHAHTDNVRHVEIFFDPQTHTARGISFETMLGGLRRALLEAEAQHGITFRLIMCFLRHLSEGEAIATLEAAKPFLHRIDGVGLDSSEVGHPPSKFARVFSYCRELGLPVVAHAGEEGPAAYVHEALDLLHVSRIDHGVRSTDDPALVQRLVASQTPLTVCPLSNLRLKVVDDLSHHNLRQMLSLGLNVCINSDDPAYFGGYVNDNFEACIKALDLSADEVLRLAKNSIRASWLDEARKQALLDEADRVYIRWLEGSV
ncbi:adenosine deaminase [Laribacter hongkongensis]|uniref:adenosine deaminase n=1 Tax=Laribacter hongkongensis TaxID=168471 RepID=UPI001878D9DF|nr:adenosine deaminase [Laribacter hongkongensis]MBE5527682.1 adenosine deaminase [Laribacter hongkongensis]